jgi:hypothetical protein
VRISECGELTVQGLEVRVLQITLQGEAVKVVLGLLLYESIKNCSFCQKCQISYKTNMLNLSEIQ